MLNTELRGEVPSHIDGDGDLHMYAAHSYSYIDGWMLYVHARLVSAGIHIPARIRAANYGRYFYLTVSKLSCWLPLFKCS